MTFTARALCGSKLLLVLFLLAPFFSFEAGHSEARQSVETVRLRNAVTASLPSKATWSVAATALDSGETYMDIGSEGSHSFTPGSLVKLFTTAAILEANTRERVDLDTVIFSDGPVSRNLHSGNLYIKGAGNAFLSEQDLTRAAEQIASLGIEEITGGIVIDDTLFDISGWKISRSGPAYAPPSALGLDLHTISIRADGNTMTVEPRNDAVQVVVSAGGKPGIRQMEDLVYEAAGTLPSGPVIKKRFPLTDPALYAGGVLRTLLGQKGIVVRGNVRKGKLPAKSMELVRLPSRPLEEIVRETNNHSLNVVAENLLLILAARKYGAPGTVEKGIQALKDFLTDMGIPSSEMKLADGSGVSGGNKITARDMVFFLKNASSKPWFKTFYASLPAAGNDEAHNATGFGYARIRAKTGQLPNAYCLAGYIDRKDGRRIAFAYMVNGEGAGIIGAVNASGTEVLRHLTGD